MNSISPDSLVSPDFLNLEVAKKWALIPNLNVQWLNDAAIDQFIHAKLTSRAIRRLSIEESTWISQVSRYISSKGYQVDFYRNYPTLPLSTPDTFISMDGWDTLPILPPMGESPFREIADKLPGLWMLSDLNIEPLKDRLQDYVCDKVMTKFKAGEN